MSGFLPNLQMRTRRPGTARLDRWRRLGWAAGGRTLLAVLLLVSPAMAQTAPVGRVAFPGSHKEVAVAGGDARSAALIAGRTRLRPVLMTAFAMLIGMVPMSLALGEGGEQNAPLGRAVIGGLTVATVYTLFFVPVMYSLMRREPPKNFDAEKEG